MQPRQHLPPSRLEVRRPPVRARLAGAPIREAARGVPGSHPTEQECDGARNPSGLPPLQRLVVALVVYLVHVQNEGKSLLDLANLSILQNLLEEKVCVKLTNSQLLPRLGESAVYLARGQEIPPSPAIEHSRCEGESGLALAAGRL